MLWIGLVLIAVTICMVVLARPVNGEPASFLKIWFVGQAYILAALTSAVIGVTFVIGNLPF